MVIFIKRLIETFRIFCSEAKTEYMDAIVTLCNFAPNPRWTVVNVSLTVVFDIANSTKNFHIFLYFFPFFVSVFTFFTWCCHPQFQARWSFIKNSTGTALIHSAVKWSVLVCCISSLVVANTDDSVELLLTVNWVLEKNCQGIISSHYFQISHRFCNSISPFVSCLAPGFTFLCKFSPAWPPFCFWGSLCWYICCVFKRFVVVLKSFGFFFVRIKNISFKAIKNLPHTFYIKIFLIGIFLMPSTTASICLQLLA